MCEYGDNCPKTGRSQQSKVTKDPKYEAEHIKYTLTVRESHTDSIMDPSAEQADDSARESQGPNWAEG